MMTTENKSSKWQSAGGRATAILLRKRALDEYYRNPNKCLFCGEIIKVPDHKKVAEIKVKNFCGHRCSAQFSNSRRSRVRKTHSCLYCGTSGLTGRRKLCPECSLYGVVRLKKKGDVHRMVIQGNAQKVYRNFHKEVKCFCGYKHHAQICHIKAVKDFSSTTLLREINDISNLIALCPNHHWELDNGILKI